MRKLDLDFIEKFDNEFKFIIDYVKNNTDVFLGIRENYIDLYVCGGCFFKILKRKNGYFGVFEDNGYSKYLNISDINLINSINKKILDDDSINKWCQLLDRLKEAVENYMNNKDGKAGKTSKEKILQQKLVIAFNNSSEYYAYDFEYNVESLNEYYMLLDKNTPDYDLKNVKGKVKTQTVGRVDTMLIEIKENKVHFKLMEIKEGTDAIDVMGKKTKFYGNGIIGHVNMYMQIIDYVKRDKPYESFYRRATNKKPNPIDIRKTLLSEVQHIMNFYKRFDLIKNLNFKNKNYDNLEFEDIELVFYLGGYNMKSKILENHLGLSRNQADSVVNLINRNNDEMKYEYINSNQIYDFKYYKDNENYKGEKKGEKLDIKNYNQVKVEKLDYNKIRLYE